MKSVLRPSAEAVASAPEWLPHSFDNDGRRMAAVYVPRQEHAKLAFLHDEVFRNRYPIAIHDRSAIEAALGQATTAPLHFIFHTAFCCSTLLVRALDLPGVATGLKEPGLLNELKSRLALKKSGSEALLDLTLRLLSRPFAGDRAVVVKPSNAVNPIIDAILEHRREAKAVLLYSDVRTFLLAVTNYGMGRRSWVRQIYSDLASWTSLRLDTNAKATFEKTDLQVAALAWVLQMHHFSQIAARFGPERVAPINSAHLLANPREVLASVVQFFDLGLSPSRVGEIVDGPTFATYSKAFDAGYSIEQRQRDQQAAERAHGAEVDEATNWLRTVISQWDVELFPGVLS